MTIPEPLDFICLILSVGAWLHSETDDSFVERILNLLNVDVDVPVIVEDVPVSLSRFVVDHLAHWNARKVVSVHLTRLWISENRRRRQIINKEPVVVSVLDDLLKVLDLIISQYFCAGSHI